MAKILPMATRLEKVLVKNKRYKKLKNKVLIDYLEQIWFKKVGGAVK